MNSADLQSKIHIFILALSCNLVCAHGARAQQTGGDLEQKQLTFSVNSGHEFPARLVLPPGEIDAQRSVVLFGGGLANDLNWSVPGSLQVDGAVRQMTIGGQDYAAAPHLASALARAGFPAMHWSTIRRGDPNADLWPSEATVYSWVEQLEMCRAAVDTMVEQRAAPEDRVVLIGYSLGAARAANIAATDERIAGLVLLAPAWFTRPAAFENGKRASPNWAQHALVAADFDADKTCSRQEWTEWTKQENEIFERLAGQTFDELDYDQDDQLRQWELVAGFERASRMSRGPVDNGAGPVGELRWIEDILAAKPIPTLVIAGGLDDAQSHQIPIISDQMKRGTLSQLTLRMMPDIGHQLGPERDGRIGPIADEVLAEIIEWLTAQFPIGEE